MASHSLFEGLNESQRRAVSHVDGPLLVLAGPGSGKTRVVTHRIAHMIDQGVEPSSILALTFTNKAAQEMRSRIVDLIGDADLWMGTFHSFCVRLLRRYARLVGLPESFSIYDVADAESALKAAAQAARFEFSHISLGQLGSRISHYKNRLITPEVLEAEALSSEEHAVGQVYPHYQQFLLENGAVDFDDILMHTAILLRSNPELRSDWDRRLRYVMVDEYQDTNLAQYVIVRHLSADFPNLAVTGDPDQSIYGWRGANAQNVNRLESDYPNLQVVRLEDNYRSTPEILATADFLIQHNTYRKDKRLVPKRSGGNSVRLVIYPTAREEAEDIAEQIATLHEGGTPLSHFAVLYRTNAHSRSFEHALMRRQLPFQLIGGYRFYMRKEVKDLVAYLLLIYNPEDGIALQRAINSPPRGIGKQTIARIQDCAQRRGLPLLQACRECATHGELSKRATTAVRGFLKIYDQLCDLAHGPLVDLLETTIELTKYREHLQKQHRNEDDESDLLANLDELLAEAHELDRIELDRVDEAEQTPLERFLEVAVLQADADRMESDSDQVTLMTLHAAKGLEFENVYIVAVEENVLPHSRSKDDPMQLEEERRLFFVGITRAKDQLQVSYAKRRGFSGNTGSGVPSSFLMELPRNELQIQDRTAHAYGSSGSPYQFDELDQRDPYVDESPAEYLEDTSGDAIDFDDCQLPPDELQARVGQLSRQLSGAAHAASQLSPRQKGRRQSPIRTEEPGRRSASGSTHTELLSSGGDNPWPGIHRGAWVFHNRFGPGEVVADAGTGAKRSVTVAFLNDQSHRTFRLSHVELTPTDRPTDL